MAVLVPMMINPSAQAILFEAHSEIISFAPMLAATSNWFDDDEAVREMTGATDPLGDINREPVNLIEVAVLIVAVAVMLALSLH